MLTKNQTKRILSLSQKKYRQQLQLFLAEGPKVVQEFLQASYEPVEILSTHELYQSSGHPFSLISEKELHKISTLKTPNQVVGVFKIPEPKPINPAQLILAVDGLNNPGNLGTMIRLCDWFGIRDMICSYDSVDCYNPKVIQSAMGSHTRVNVTYLDLENFLHSQSVTYGTFMDGLSIYDENFPMAGVVVMGNEANGISKKIERLVSKRLTIPRIGIQNKTESLNVANATAIILSEIRRQHIV